VLSIQFSVGFIIQVSQKFHMKVLWVKCVVCVRGTARTTTDMVCRHIKFDSVSAKVHGMPMISRLLRICRIFQDFIPDISTNNATCGLSESWFVGSDSWLMMMMMVMMMMTLMMCDDRSAAEASWRCR